MGPRDEIGDFLDRVDRVLAEPAPGVSAVGEPDEVAELHELYDIATLRRLGYPVGVSAGDAAGEAGDDGPGVGTGRSPSFAPDTAAVVDGIDGADGGATDGRSGRGRRSMAGVVLAGALLGVGEVYEPPDDHEAVVWEDPGAAPFDDRPVQFVYVPGHPRLSRIILRPWLRAG